MRHIVAKHLTIEGLKSFSRRVEVDLRVDPGLTFVAGDNRVDPRLGANGAGKSPLFDAVCFACYGTSIHGQRISDVVTHGAKRCHAALLLEVDGVEVEVSHSGPPVHGFIDGNQVDQPEIDALLGMSRRRFLNSVIFGQAMPLLLDMDVPARGDLLDEVMDLQVWMRAADLAGKRQSSVIADINKLRVEVGRTEGALGALEDPDELRRMSSEWSAAIGERRKRLRAVLRAARAEGEALQDRLDTLVTSADDGALYDALKKAQRAESNLRAKKAVLESRLSAARDDLEFFRENARCPSCEQDIAPELAQQHVERHEAEIEGISNELKGVSGALRDAVKAAGDAQRRHDEDRRARSAAEADAASVKAQARAKAREVDQIQEQLAQLDSEANPHEAALERNRAARRDLKLRLRDQRKQETVLSTKSAQYEFWKQGFRRVRLFCIDRVLRQLEVETMNAAESLGLVGWRISYATETETKSGTSKMGVQVEVHPPDDRRFSNWWGGEAQRVRLCTGLGFAGLIQRWAGVRYGFEVFDEPTNWLSEAGIEDLLDMLKNRADARGTRIFLADHRALTHSGFDQVMTVIKDENGSHVG